MNYKIMLLGLICFHKLAQVYILSFHMNCKLIKVLCLFQRLRFFWMLVQLISSFFSGVGSAKDTPLFSPLRSDYNCVKYVLLDPTTGVY